MQTNRIYERARLARDRRFDGQFYVGVLTTGIYCRPICPANPPKSENVRFFSSAAAAGEAGFRPCLRCRPECAPGSPAWTGTSATVRRGLRLIAGGALDQGDVDHLADRLGVTGRHLRRLFATHIGASPLAVAHTQRLHFAKRLIDDTALPLGSIADAAGFGSVRRFNDAFKKTYGRSPRELRKMGGGAPAAEQPATLSVRLAYRQPFDWQAVLGFFRPRLTPGVETIVDGHYCRALESDGNLFTIEVAQHDRADCLLLTLRGVDTQSIYETVRRTREVFDLDAPIHDVQAALSLDPTLKQLLGKHMGVRVPGAWDGFELTVRAVLGQQISVRAATTIAGRIVSRYGEPLPAAMATDSGLGYLFPTPGRLMRARFNGIGLVSSRAETLRRVAAAVASGELDFDAVGDPRDSYEKLKSIKGIGDWTAQYVMMRALKNPDAFPASDLGLLKAIGGTPRTTPAELAGLAEHWRPWRAYAAMLLWSRSSDSGG